MIDRWFPTKGMTDFHLILSMFYQVKNSKLIIQTVLLLSKGLCHIPHLISKCTSPVKPTLTFRSGMSIFDMVVKFVYTHLCSRSASHGKITLKFLNRGERREYNICRILISFNKAFLWGGETASNER